MIGVDYDLFWTLNPNTIKPFIKAFELQLEHEDRLLWMQGKYIQIAVASVMDEKAKYPDIPFTSEDVEMGDDEKIILFRNKIIDRMNMVNVRAREGEK